MADRIVGSDQILIRLGLIQRHVEGALGRASEQIAAFLEDRAKRDRGLTPRPAGWVYPGGGVKRWREAGLGWGDVTGRLVNAIKGDVKSMTPDAAHIEIVAGMEYAAALEFARRERWAWFRRVIEINKSVVDEILRRNLELP